jgi:hypothetical protein
MVELATMSFNIDFSDPDDVAAKLPALRRLYEEKLVEQRTLNEYIEGLRRLLGFASGVSRGQVQPRSGSSPAVVEQLPRRKRPSPAQDRAVKALEMASAALGGSALGPTSLFKFMRERGLDAPKNAGLLGTHLHDAWQAGKIMRAPNGVYTPLDGTGQSEWDRPLTDYYYAGEMGLPVPGSWPPADR